MNKSRLWLVLILCGMTVWSYKVFNTAQAFTVAKAELENRTEISQPLGEYSISYDWWFGVFRALRYGEIQEFEFHLQGEKDDAISVVEVVKKQDAWRVSCIKVVSGEYLNKKLIQDCHGLKN